MADEVNKQPDARIYVNPRGARVHLKRAISKSNDGGGTR